MTLKTVRFVTLILAALFMGLEFCHALELPPKIQYDGRLYVTLQNTLYQYFGFPGPGALVTVGAVISALVLSFLTRKRRPSFYWTLSGTICLAIAFPVVFFSFIEPVNIIIRQATPTSIPSDWMRLRYQWEYAHAANFVLTLVGFSALLFSVLVETSIDRFRTLGNGAKL
ncbi:MAG: DUF1772 domain-containing protein [Cyanosarcina radialis HA8281-LM2]|jgi:hypothetical protein|nr:DUF1772 domain-containing protein [Cyanosarcina radialis HA8281-LM2]